MNRWILAVVLVTILGVVLLVHRKCPTCQTTWDSWWASGN